MYYEMVIKVLSPLHVSSEQEETKQSNFFVRGDKVAVCSEKYLANALKRQGLVTEYVAFMDNGYNLSLESFLKQLPGKQRADLESNIVKRVIPFRREGTRNPARMRLFTTDPLSGQLLIPASSVKGALRVSLLCRLSQTSPEFLENEVVKNLGENRKKAGEKLDKRLLQMGGLENASSPNQDWLRTVKIADGAVPADASEIMPVKIVSLNNKGRGYHLSGRGITLFVECLKPGTAFKISLEFDQLLYQQLKIKNQGKALFVFEEFIENLSSRYTMLLEKEKQFARRAGLKELEDSIVDLEEQGADFRLGWGSGLLSTSVSSLLNDEKQRQIRARFFKRRENPFFPQSRKIIFKNGRPAAELGWCRIELKKTSS